MKLCPGCGGKLNLLRRPKDMSNPDPRYIYCRSMWCSYKKRVREPKRDKSNYDRDYVDVYSE